MWSTIYGRVFLLCNIAICDVVFTLCGIAIYGAICILYDERARYCQLYFFTTNSRLKEDNMAIAYD